MKSSYKNCRTNKRNLAVAENYRTWKIVRTNNNNSNNSSKQKYSRNKLMNPQSKYSNNNKTTKTMT